MPFDTMTQGRAKSFTRHDGVRGNGGTAPLILNVGTRGRVISYTPRSRHPQKSYRYPLNMEVGEPQSSGVARTFAPPVASNHSSRP